MRRCVYSGTVFEYYIMSRKQAEEYSCYVHNTDSIVISITDPLHNECGGTFAKIHPNEENKICEVLRFMFDDVEKSVVGESSIPYILISEQNAQDISNFVKRWAGRVKRIIVHCEAGISRSAGCCAAIMNYFENTDEPVFNGYFCPNMTVYRTVLEKLYRE